MTTETPSSIWYPVHISDMDKLSSETLEYGGELEADHPGFLDHEYRKRRVMIAHKAKAYLYSTPFPVIEYTASENATWETLYHKLGESHRRHAHSVYLREYKKIQFPSKHLPCLKDISNQLHRHSGFVLRPVSGLLTARDFLNALAIKVFHSTQYIRHHSKPMYTPEPDIVHEMLGHLPLLMDSSFARLTQTIGLLSLGATDDVVDKLAHLYWFTVEYGVAIDNHVEIPLDDTTNANCNVKTIGAGLLSSYGELENAHECIANHHLRKVNDDSLPEPDHPIFSCEECKAFGEKFLSKHPLYNSRIASDDHNKKIGDNETHFHVHLHEYDCKIAATHAYPISSYQPVFMSIASFDEAREQIVAYAEKELYVKLRFAFDETTQSIVNIESSSSA